MLNRMSLDGYFASLDEASFRMGWFIHDPEVICGGAPGLSRTGTQNPSNNRMRETAEELTEMTKVVFSRMIGATDWANTQLDSENPAETVRRMKEQPGSDMLVLGSGLLVQQLMEEGLLYEFLVILTPVVLGEGRPLFPGTNRFGLQLREARSFDSGNVLLHYSR